MRSRHLLLIVVLGVLLVGGPLLVPATPAPGTVPGRDLAGPDGRFTTLDGVEVHHRVVGPDDAPAVVLLHHFYGSVATWRHVMAGLSDDHRVAAYDRPAFGLTERVPRERWLDGVNPYTRASSARLTTGLMDELGVDRAVLVGSSAGGTSALETFARDPDRVRALVLISPAITGDVGPPGWVRSVMRTPQLRRLGPKVVRRVAGDITPERVTGSWHDPSKVTVADLEAYADPLQVDGWDVGFWELFAAERPPDLTTVLGTIDVPTLVVVGASDPVITAEQNRATAAAIPGASFVEIPSCGHTPQEECPDQLLEVVRTFLVDLPRDTTPTEDLDATPTGG